MRPRTAYRKRFADKPNLYQEITDQIIAELEAGCVPWVQPWGSSGINAALGLPKNVATGRQYSGINILILWFPPRQPFPDRCRCRLPLRPSTQDFCTLTTMTRAPSLTRS